MSHRPFDPHRRWPGRWHQRWHRRFRHSLRWRLVALFLVLAAGTTAIFVAGFRVAFSGGFEVLVKPLLSDYVDRLAADIGSPPDIERARALTLRLPIVVRIDGPQLHWVSDPALDRRSDDHFRMRHDGGVPMFSRRTADGHLIQFGLGEILWTGRHRWVWVVPLGALLLTAAAYATVRRLFRPLDDIRGGAMRYGGGDFTTPIPIRRHDELGELASQVNAMASGLQGMLKGQRALLLAISHELRSPLTRARLNAELAPPGAERDALLRDLGLMSELIADLLESERLAAGPAALKRENTDLNTLLGNIVAQHFAGQPLRLTLAPDLPPLAVDRARITLLVRNLIDNALKHGGEASPVELATQLDVDGLRLTVRDHGPGVPPDELTRLAEPFYRPDSARARSAGGVGLGLYLCRLVAQSHGAELTLRNATPGLEAEVRWAASG